MGIANTLSTGFAKIVEKAGKPIRLRYFLGGVGSVWDDEVTYAEVTDFEVWTSGVVMAIDNKQGSEDLNLLEQGKLTNQDLKLYVNGSLNFGGGDYKITIGMNGSPTQTDNFEIIPIGGIPYEVEATEIYKKVYIRKSLISTTWDEFNLVSGAAADTYFKYNKTTERVELWVCGSKQKEWGNIQPGGMPF